MSTAKQKQAARKNLEKARAARAKGTTTSRTAHGPMSSAQKADLDESRFAFPDERKEPLTDASHVRNAVARFTQVEGVGDAERDRAWRRITAAADRFGVELSEKDWRELA